ncbi:preprotein translocase subunit SecG [Facilibium subflavum]|uniref:preprotein translocase subunit SecG n=1 Tax=Facilibium subflavum TaxID=2219058 RepID=UPI000E64EFC7|nr:preprotein translocase subunit SecG [Facilibium subflavum]
MFTLVITIHIVVAVLIVAVILLQQGKGASMGASFGSGSSQTVFGSRGAAPFLFKFTAFLVAVFFVTSISLSYIGKHLNTDASAQANSGVSQVDFQKQQAQQQQLIDEAKAQPAQQKSVEPASLDSKALLKTDHSKSDAQSGDDKAMPKKPVEA